MATIAEQDRRALAEELQTLLDADTAPLSSGALRVNATANLKVPR